MRPTTATRSRSSTRRQLTTAAISASTSASAVMRSKSKTSSTTMSPGQTRRSSRSIFLSTRAVPTTPGREAFRESSADIFMGGIVSAERCGSGEARRNTSHTSYKASHLSQLHIGNDFTLWANLQFACRRQIRRSAGRTRRFWAASSSSRACARPVSDSPSPASIRASSATRSSPLNRRTPLDPPVRCCARPDARRRTPRPAAGA